ncbi:MAG: N-acetylmannosamine-6-phosphate 2-epimerase [Candidatus Methanomethylicaceae archaeon]
MSWKDKLDYFIEKTKAGLIVSCQADKGEPFYGTKFMVAFAIAAKIGGAVGIRTNGPLFIKAIKKVVDLPIIGIYKKRYENSEVYITPTKKEAKIIARAGADIIGIDCTFRKRPGNLTTEEFIKYIKEELNLPVLADISTLEEGIEAESKGADIICTTLSGYTEYTKDRLILGPDINLVKELTKNVKIPVIAEGRYWTQNDIKKALEAGAHAVVVGTAITKPHYIVMRLLGKI